MIRTSTLRQVCFTTVIYHRKIFINNVQLPFNIMVMITKYFFEFTSSLITFKYLMERSTSQQHTLHLELLLESIKNYIQVLWSRVWFCFTTLLLLYVRPCIMLKFSSLDTFNIHDEDAADDDDMYEMQAM